MHTSPIILIHIGGAVIGLLSGFLAMLFRKGSGLHAAAGTAFFVSMLCMSSSAAYIAEFMRPNKVNFLVAILTFYLVSTAWVAARRRDGKPGLFDRIALLIILADGVGGVIWGFQAASSPKGLKDGMPAFLYFMFGSFALLSAALDVRMIRRGGVVGSKRIVRHLCRMCFALLITTFSLYPGQAKLFSTAVRSTNLMFVPHVLLIGSFLFWVVRMRRSKAASRQPITPEPAPRSQATGVAWPLPARDEVRAAL
jgi:uncharacterized membrane protein